jgi:hypothetical protein
MKIENFWAWRNDAAARIEERSDEQLEQLLSEAHYWLHYAQWIGNEEMIAASRRVMGKLNAAALKRA